MKYEWLQNLLLRAGVDQRAYDDAKPTIRTGNRSSLIIYSAVAMVLLLMLLISSFALEAISPYRPAYLTSMLLSAAALLYATLLCDRYPQWLTPCIYLFLAVMLAFGIILGVASNPEDLSVTFPVLMVAIPLMFIDRPIRMLLMLLIAVVSFDVVILFTKTGETLQVDMLNSIAFGALGGAVGVHMLTVKVGRIVYSERSDLLSRTDLLTGCKNRNCYEREVSGCGSSCCDSLACVYVDVNGLHEMNDLHGHTAGDTMLKYVAEHMQSTFGDDAVYRIGGDEYVAMVRDVPQPEIERRLDQLLADVERVDYHIAVGYALHRKNELDLLQLIRTAESNMYEAKRQFYETTGKVRRRR